MSNWDQRSRGNYGNSRDGNDNEQRQSYPNSGALFPVKQKRSDNSPDVTGNVVISDEVLDYIVREAQNGNEVKLDLSGWMRISRSNMNFTSIKINIPYDVRMQEGGNPVYRQSSGRPPQRAPRDDRQAQRQPQTRGYAQQSGRTDRADDFRRGDSMPDFLRDDDDEVPFE